MALRVVFRGNVSEEYRRAMTATLNGIARASSLATRATAKLIKARGSADIAKSGQFGARWLEGLTATAEPANGFFISNTITVAHSELGARNFEFGGVVSGRPLLWIPLSFSDAKGKRARDYPGGLFRVERKGGARPLLLAIRDKKPKYVGVPMVRIPQKWHIRDIGLTAIQNDFPALYQQNLKVT